MTAQIATEHPEILTDAEPAEMGRVVERSRLGRRLGVAGRRQLRESRRKQTPRERREWRLIMSEEHRASLFGEDCLPQAGGLVRNVGKIRVQ